jgi:hypothetical protein
LDSIIVEKFSELFLFVKNNKKNITGKDIANYTLNSFKINKYKNSVEFLPEIMSFIKNNIEDKALEFTLKLCRSQEKDRINEVKYVLLKKFLDKSIHPLTIERALRTEYSLLSDYWENYTKSRELTLTADDAVTLTNLIYEKDVSVEYLQNFYKKALSKKRILETFEKKVDEDDLKKLLFSHARKTLNTLEFLGEKAFLYSFIDKYPKVKESIISYGDIQHQMYYEDILEIINPRSSKKYKDALMAIKELKKDFNDKSPQEKKISICGINENNQIIKKRLSLVGESLLKFYSAYCF